MDRFRLPRRDKVEHRPNDRRTGIELKLPGDDGQGIAAVGFARVLVGAVRRSALDLIACRANHVQHCGTAGDTIEYRGQRSGTAIAFLVSIWSNFCVSPIPPQRSHGGAKLNRIDIELGQGSGAKQTDVISDGRYRAQAREEVAHLGRIRDVEILDGERNLRVGQLANYVVTVSVRAIQNR